MTDYVIVGGGSAGSVLAGRLSEDPATSVCLLEAGGDGRDVLIRAPAGAAAMIGGWPLKINNWAYDTEPQPGLNGRRGYQPRGRALGGSSAINAMLYVRGHPSDYDDWQSSGCPGWSWKDVLPYFRKSENNERGADEWHGEGGPLQVSNQRSPMAVTEAFIEAATQNQLRRNEDFNGERQEGVGYYQVTQFSGGEKNGERCSAAAGYLHPNMSRPNLDIVLDAHATGLIVEGDRVVGVKYRKKGQDHEIRAEREVILCGGAFNSPQLLLLSGIGPREELARHNIPLRHELPGVGQNLQDHIDFILVWKSKRTDVFGIGLRGGIDLFKAALQWRRDGTGTIASPYAEGGAFIKSDPALERPDLQVHFVPAIVDDHTRKMHLGHGITGHVCVLRPKSRGEVGLNSADPMAPPRIDPQFFSDEADLDRLLGGVRILRRILDSPPLAPWRHKEVYTEGVTSDDELKQHIRDRADTIYHPVGTCRMGSDDMAVVDPELKLRGLSGLRVCDASVMPTLIGGNTNAPTIMIAEKCADMIRSDTVKD